MSLRGYAMTVVTRFAPSPTGFLHIGGARTALFNWLFARHHHGKFLLRIEDTDRIRSTQAAIDAIIDGMEWLGLNWDQEAIYQYSRASHHREIAEELLAKGKAYRCYTTAEELDSLRKAAEAEGKVYRFQSPWRDRDASEAPAGAPYVVRLRAPKEGTITINDEVQGEVIFPAAEIDDLVLLRSDGVPTYNLAVVVDDHDMGVTHIIRGDDHLNNAPKQQLIYQAMGWNVPSFSHIPLIHGADGAKLSKRHGALGIDAYRDMGYLPEAMRNYLLRLGWGHGDAELISTEQAIEWFDLKAIGKSPSRMDFAKLENVNAHYIKESVNSHLLHLIAPIMEDKKGAALSSEARERILKGLGGLKQRAKNLQQLADSAMFYAHIRPIPIEDAAQKPLAAESAKKILPELHAHLQTVEEWTDSALEAAIKSFVTAKAVPFKDVGMPLRAALTGTLNAPSVSEVMMALGKTESLSRISDVI